MRRILIRRSTAGDVEQTLTLFLLSTEVTSTCLKTLLQPPYSTLPWHCSSGYSHLSLEDYFVCQELWLDCGLCTTVMLGATNLRRSAITPVKQKYEIGYHYYNYYFILTTLYLMFTYTCCVKFINCHCQRNLLKVLILTFF